MPTSYTTSLGLALPVTGDLSGTWGDTVNDYISKYIDSAVAGAQTISGSQTAVTLSKSTGVALTQAGTGITGSAQYQIINCTGNPASQLTVTVPATSKTYLVLNNTSSNQSVKIVGAGPTTGVTVAANRCALIAWNGTDFEVVASTDVAALQGLGTGVAAALAINLGSSGAVVTNDAANTFTAAQTFRLAATQDAVALAGRAGGTSSYAVTLTPTTLASNTTLTLPNVTDTLAVLGTAQAFTAAQTFRAASAIRSEAAATQDAVVVAGRAGGTASYAITLTPATLASNTTLTLPNVTDTVATIGTAQTFTAAQTFRAASAIRSEAASTQDAVVVAGRAGGTSSYAVTLTPTTLSASRTLTLPDATTTVAGTDATQTLTNKRIDPRVSSTTSTSSVTPDVASFDMYAFTALAANLTINAPTGTPVNGTKLMFRILDNGTSRTLTWNGTYVAIGVTLPATTTTSKTTYVGCIYNAGATRWDVIAVTTQA